MIDSFLNWGDHGKPNRGKIKGRWQPIESASSRYCERQLVIKNDSGDSSQLHVESAKYFEWLIVLIIEFGFSMMRIIIMQISVAVIHVNGLLDLDNSSHHTMPHSIIAKSKD